MEAHSTRAHHFPQHQRPSSNRQTASRSRESTNIRKAVDIEDARYRLISAALILVGIVHIIPVVGVVSAEALSKAYGIKLVRGDLLKLL